MTDFKICSLNVKGLRDRNKRRELFLWLREKTFSLYFLQETHSTVNDITCWNNEWDSKAIWSHGTSNSKGTAILFHSKFDCSIIKSVADPNGRYIIVDIKVSDKIFTCVNIYAPNDDCPQFFVGIDNVLDDFQGDNIIYGGDFNSVLNLCLDKKGGRPRTNFKARSEILKFMDKRCLVDIWRNMNPDLKMFTWKSNSNPPIFCRLDYFLITKTLKTCIESSDITHGYRTDHSMVSIVLNNNYEKPGKGFWKLNVSLLSDPDYIKMVKKTIENVVNENNEANPSLLWETIKCVVRGDTISYSVKKSRERNKLQNNLETDIADLELHYSHNLDPSVLTILERKRKELEIIYGYRAKGAMMRSKARWVEEGEKNSKYFLNLEKRNYTKKCICKLKNCKGDVITASNEILEEEADFYAKLYTSCNNINCNEDFYDKLNITDNDIPKVSYEEANSCEGIITLNECANAVQSMANSKSPGSDGYPIEFYKMFWNQIGKILVKSFNHSFGDGKLSDSQCRGIISLIPKDGKDELLLKNWRPISLLNVDYKIAAKIIANRMKNVLGSVISNDQTGFLPNRYIGENVRLILDVIEFADINDIPGTLFFIDFEKAYDKLEWSFIARCLEQFGFGNDIRKWVKLFYTNISSCVINNGHTSNYFKLTRGVRQGCPLSCYIFIICAEIMSIAIRCNDNIKGITIDDSETKITQFADDTTLILDGSKSSICNAIKIIENFGDISGLKLNVAKSNFLKIGSLQNNDDNFFPEKNYIWTKGPVKFLGVNVSLNKNEMYQLNYETQLKKLQNTLDIWKQRDLTPIGKITIVKSLALSQLTYLFSVLPNPPNNFMKKLEQTLFKFIWNGKPDKINRDTMYCNKEDGGLKMTNVHNLVDSLKIAWVKRYLDSENLGKWKIIFCKEITNIGGEWIWLCNPTKDTDFCYDKLCNAFLSDVIKAWYRLKKSSNDTITDEVLWYNTKIKVNKSTVFYKTWSVKGVNFISDLLYENQRFMTYNEFTTVHNINCNYMKYFGLVNAVSTCFNKQLMNQNLTHESELMRQIKSVKKTTSFAYQSLSNKVNVVPKAQQKWITEFDNMPDSKEIIWKNVYSMPYRCTLDTKTQYLQYRFIHKILPTNTFLYRIGLVDDYKCNFCKTEEETMKHLMWSCNYVSKMWSDVCNWLKDLNINVNITYWDVCFGIYGNKEYLSFLNMIILLLKRYIYRCRVQEMHPLFNDYKNVVIFTEKMEKNIAKNRDKYGSHVKKWEPFL